MKKTAILRLICALSIMNTAMMAMALSANHFASSSRLSQGHWVKIAVSQSGVYEIDRQQLAEMGFSDPSRMQVYGYGGKMLSDALTNDLPDDLQQIPIMRLSDKICFYASGNVQMSLADAGNGRIAFSRQRNTYSLQGYYFLTESGDEANKELSLQPFDEQAGNLISNSLDCTLHEQEMRSLSFTGSELLGEDITLGNRSIDFELINQSCDTIYLTTRIASKIVRTSNNDTKSDVRGQIFGTLTTDGVTSQLPYDASSGFIKGSTKDYTFYETGLSTIAASMQSTSGKGSLRYWVEETSGAGTMQVAILDYFIVTYQHHNKLSGHDNAQFLMGYAQTDSNDKIVVDGTASTLVWDITNDTLPVSMAVEGSDSEITFTPGQNSDPRLFIAFDPNATLLQIDSYNTVDNQNLHSLATPDMLIITNSTFMEQAERVAELHRKHDGMDVTVVDHEQIFNEFSSGTPSAMAYRLMCKMFFDRDQSKFKNLLLFGHSSFDNRGIVTGKANRLMCYETALSNYDDNSHVIEDYFGYLGDNSGLNLSSDSLKIAVGRIPSSSVSEAKSDVDKLYEYVLSPDYGAWRNKYGLWAEKSTDEEKKMHESQADGIGYIIDNDAKMQMLPDKAFVGMFPRNVNEAYLEEKDRGSGEAKKHIKEMLNEGLFFATYVGHAGANSFTHSGMWTASDVSNTSYTHWPIMTTACCDVARFDSDHQGIAEKMFHKRDGGAIALFTTARQVYSNSNDELNRAFTKALFNYNVDKRMPTLGEVYMKAKLTYGRTANSNKLNFILLGDPAMKINYPKQLFKITRLNNTNLTGPDSVTVRPLQKLRVEAQVMNENDPTTVNTGFNGDATIIIKDYKREFMTVNGTGTHKSETHTITYPQEVLVQVNGRVVNGNFTATVVIPRFERAKSSGCTLSVYAHEDGTDQMVNGITEQLIIGTYVSNNTVSDNVPPVIESMFLNDAESFAANAQVSTDAMLYIHATDSTAINLQQQSLGTGIQLKLDDGKKSFNLVKNNAQLSDEGRTLDIKFPVTGLTPGRHTLSFSVCDVCGNTASRTISFVVMASNDITLSTSERASNEFAEIDINTSSTLTETPEVNLKVTNAKGELVWTQATSTFPYVWNLTDMDGNRVKPGLYKIHGNFENDEGFGGSNIVNFVVLNPLSSLN